MLLTFRRPAVLGSTIEAILSQTYPPHSLLVVDNDPEMSARDVVARFPSVDYLSTGANLGPAGGLAMGVAAVLSSVSSDDWLLLLDDDDPPIHRDDLERLLMLINSVGDDRVAAVGIVGARFDRARGRSVRVQDHELTGVVDVDWIGGNQLPIYRMDAVRAVGGPNPDLFFGLDDLEFGVRLRRAGWRVVADGDAWFERRTAYSRTQMDLTKVRRGRSDVAWREYYNARNQILVARWHGRPGARWLAAADGLARSIRASLRRDGREVARGSFGGVLDGLRGRLGATVQPVAKYPDVRR